MCWNPWEKIMQKNEISKSHAILAFMHCQPFFISNIKVFHCQGLLLIVIEDQTRPGQWDLKSPSLFWFDWFHMIYLIIRFRFNMVFFLKLSNIIIIYRKLPFSELELWVLMLICLKVRTWYTGPSLNIRLLGHHSQYS